MIRFMFWAVVVNIACFTPILLMCLAFWDSQGRRQSFGRWLKERLL